MGAIARRTAELFWVSSPLASLFLASTPFLTKKPFRIVQDTFQCEIHIFSPTSAPLKWTEEDTK